MSPTNRITFAGLGILAAVLMLFVIRPVPLERVELVLLDLRFGLRGPIEPRHEIGVIAIDTRSIDEFGWRRDVIAEVIERLDAAGAAAIGLDIVFSESGSTQQDALLEAALLSAPDAVLGFYFRTRDEAAAPGNATLSESLELVREAQVRVARLTDDARLPILACRDVEPNTPRLSQAARHMGFFSAVKDADGSVRRSALVGSCGGRLYTSLPLAIVETALGRRASIDADEVGIRRIRVGNIDLASDASGRMNINYRGPAHTFPHYSVSDLLGGRIPDAELRGKILIVGTTEPGIMDVHPTPFDASFPGVEVHANIVDSILSGDGIRRSDSTIALEILLMLLFGGLLSVLVPRFSGALRGAALASGLFVGLLALGFWLFVQHNVWLNLSYPGLTLASVYLGIAILQNVRVEGRNREIRDLFASYVGPSVVDEMLRNPDSFRLGGEYRNLSILFSDIRDFTSLSEEIGAENIVRLLHAYLTPMTELVMNSGGTLDKYIGDAVVAFWGAPLAVENHPLRACEAALAMRDELHRLHRERADLPGMNRLRIGIGIHTADAAVGKMGSALRSDYTAIGDGMNLCSRLEGLNRYYGTELLASSDLVEHLPPSIFTRELDTIRVKGRLEGVRIYEVLGHDAPDVRERSFLEAYAVALAAYRAADWSKARQGFAMAAAERGGDAGCQMMIERIQLLEKEPPVDWDGIWTFQTK